MKKNSSYKSIKPLNTTLTYCSKPPQTPTHSVSYRKLNTLQLMNQRPIERQQIYPMTAKYSTLSTTNATRKKMFSSKNLQLEPPVRPLTLNKPSGEENGLSTGYSNIRSKITDLQTRLNDIKKTYDQSGQNRKYSQKDKSIRLMKENDRSANTKVASSSKNKQNEMPKQKKTQSKLLLQRYQTNKKLKSGESVSTINLHHHAYQQQQNTQSRVQLEYGKPPLSPKNMMNITNGATLNAPMTSKKTQRLVYAGNPVQTNTKNYSSYVPEQAKNRQQNERKPQAQIQQPVSPKSQSSYLKQFVTTFTCDNRLPLSHSTSQTNLYKPHNKLSLGNNQSKNLYYVSAILNAFESKNLTSFENLSKNHLSTSLDILTYVKNAKKVAPANFSCRPLPPVKDNRQTIVFDLDETLIHCNQNLTMEHDVALPIRFPNGQILKAGINIRPYAKQCLIELSKYFELIVFTASHECYGNVIVDHLDPEGKLIAHRYFRDSCFKTQEGFYVKDLRVIDRDLSKLLLIDNAAYSYCFQLENGVPVIPFYDNKADLELKNLIPYLREFLGVKDVRTKNQNQMKLTQYTRFKDVKSLINNLYAQSE